MIEQFPGYFRKTPDQINAIWSSCLCALDANVLLNLYRYSPETTDGSLAILSRLKDKLWLPWQAGFEFHENRLGVIDRQTRTYQATTSKSHELLALLENPREHPFVGKDCLAKVSAALKELNGVLESNREGRRKLLTDDPILAELAKIFAGRVGIPLTDEQKKIQLDSAKARCDKRVPPGFRDSSKDGDRSFGDVLIWFELIEKAKSVRQPIVFVTDDAKNDWWQEISGVVIGPLPALVQEFLAETGQQILFYRPDRFFEYASSVMNGALAPRAVEEMREQTKSRMQRRRKRRFATESAKVLWDLCHHLHVHEQDARELLNKIAEMTVDEWRKVKAPSDVAPHVQQGVETIVAKCGCLVGIIYELSEIPAPTYHDALSHVEKRGPADWVKLLVSLRQMPDEAVAYVLAIGFK